MAKKNEPEINGGCLLYILVFFLCSCFMADLGIKPWITFVSYIVLSIILFVLYYYIKDKHETKINLQNRELANKIKITYPHAYIERLRENKIRENVELKDWQIQNIIKVPIKEWEKRENAINEQRETEEKAKQEEQRLEAEKKVAKELYEKKIMEEYNVQLIKMGTDSIWDNEPPYEEETKDIYIDAIEDLHDLSMDNPLLNMPLLPLNYTIEDIFGLTFLTNDEEVKKYFPAFYGEEGIKGIIHYLYNSKFSALAGISFTHLLKRFGKTIGIIKVTSPAHNRVTNHFNHWLIDFIVTPRERGHGIATYALNQVLPVVERMGAKEIFAMVDCKNETSCHILLKQGFKVSTLQDIGINPHTGNKCILFRKIF